MHREFEQHFKNLFGKDYERFIEAIDRKPNVSIRLNSDKVIEVHFDQTKEVPWCKGAYFLKERPAFYADPLHHAGAYYVQDASSMFFTRAVDFSRPMLALDLCAAPGGKSTLILSRLNAESILISNELDLNRNKVLVENLNRWGNANSVVTNANSKQFLDFKNIFDLVVVDAPCSGEGMFRKDQVSLEQWSPNFVDGCAKIQKSLVDDAANLTADGGTLIYSTCTFEPAENENQIRSLVDNFNFEPITIEVEEDWNVDQFDIKTSKGTFKGYFFYLHKAAGEGQFICPMRKVGNAKKMKFSASRKGIFQSLGKKEEKLIRDFIQIPANYNLTEINGVVHAYQADYEALLSSLKKSIPLWKLGIKIGEVNGKNFKPNHELALSQFAKSFESRFELDYTEAISYLKRETLNVNPEWKKGWGLVTYKNVPMGWAKNIGTRINNYFPKELVLRKAVKI